MTTPDKKREDEAKNTLIMMGKCASKSQNGFLCTLTANHHGKRHKAQILGGQEDGLTKEEWDW